MGMFTKGLKKAIESQPPKTKPKKEISPLVKQTEDIFITPEENTFQTKFLPEDEEVMKSEVIGRLYSPVYSAIENMPIGKEGTKGENISAYLNKRAPNVDKAELESFDINLDPKRLYTKEEVLNLTKEKGSPDYTVERKEVVQYQSAQRQRVKDVEEDYIELSVEGKQPYTTGIVHIGRNTNIGHTRSSIRREMPEGGPLTKKIEDRPRYLLIEEIQSDLAKLRDKLFGNLVGVDPENFGAFTRYSFEDIQFEVEDDVGAAFNSSRVQEKLIDFYNLYFSPDFSYVSDLENYNIDENLITILKDDIKKITGKEPAGNTVKEVATNSLIDHVDYDNVLSISGKKPNEFELEDIKTQTNDIIKKQINKFYQDMTGVHGEESGTLTKKLPVASRSDYVKRLLLANIMLAKQNGINKIVIPNPREIAKQRADTLEYVLLQDETLMKKYEKDRKKKNFDEFKYATDYFEKIFKPLYNDSVKKVLNTLNKETNGKIKYGSRDLQYEGFDEDSFGRITKPKSYTAHAIEIDITDFEFNPEAQSIRFNEGGAVPMEEQMKLFNEGGLKDEGNSVDPVSGNDVPIGSTQEEVRDDIPAMLSEGEFVFPADVVRYVGLERLMQLRQEAKMGLKQMEAMGQMGNSEEATMPDDLPFNMADLIIVGAEGEEPKEMARGGVVHMNPGGYLPKFVDQGVETAPINIENFDTTLPDPDFSNVKKYVNKEGKVRFIPFGPDGKPLYPIPVGFFPEGELPEDTPTETEEAIPTTPTDSGSDRRQIRKSPFQEAGGFSGIDTTTEEGMQMWIDEANKISTFGNLGTGVVAAFNPMLGAAFAGFNKLQKNKVISMLDDKIANAKNQTQIDQLNKIKTRLTTKEGKGVIAQAISGFIKPIAEALGIGEQEENVMKNVAKIATDDKDKSPDQVIEEVKQAITPIIKDQAQDDSSYFGGITEDQAQDTVQTETDEGTRFAYPDVTAPKADEEGDALAFANQINKMGFDYRDTDYNRLDNYAARENYLDHGGRNYEEKEGLLNQQKPEQTISGPKASEIEPRVAPKIGDSYFGDITPKSNDSYFDDITTPEVQSTSVRPEGLPSGRAGLDQMMRFIESIKYGLSAGNELGTSNAMLGVLDWIDGWTKNDPVATGMYNNENYELESLINQNKRSEDSDANLDFTGTMKPFSGQDSPTESDIEKYLSSVSEFDLDAMAAMNEKLYKEAKEDDIENQREAAEKTALAARKASRDRRKKDTTAEDERDRQYRQYRDQRTALITADTAKDKSKKVYSAAKDRGASDKELRNIQREHKKVMKKLEDQYQGIKTGFAKGGLASRTK